jgi:hypothetical protein
MSQKGKSPQVQANGSNPDVGWADYPRIKAGEYFAYCKWAKQYPEPGFRRWTCLLRWIVLSDDLITPLAPAIPMWFALGTGKRPHASRRGKYFPEWIRANGEPPARGDRLSPKVFTHRIARVEVGDTEGIAPYSVVRKIVSWEAGAPSGHSVSKSHSQGGKEESAAGKDSCNE